MKRIFLAVAAWFQETFKQRTPEQVREDRSKTIEEIGPVSGVL